MREISKDYYVCSLVLPNSFRSGGQSITNLYLKLYIVAKDCIAVMQEGTELTKVKSNGRLYRRYYWLDNDLTEIRWNPTSKSYNKARSR